MLSSLMITLLSIIAHFLVSLDGSSFSPADARIAPWKILFIACGAVTAIVGVVNFFFLPSTVMDAVWMKSPLRRAQALDRVKDEQLGTENHVVKVRFLYLGLYIRRRRMVLIDCRDRGCSGIR